MYLCDYLFHSNSVHRYIMHVGCVLEAYLIGVIKYVTLAAVWYLCDTTLIQIMRNE